MIAYSHECSDSYTPRKLTKKQKGKHDDTKKIRRKMEAIFKSNCYTTENGWVKPRDFKIIMRDVVTETIKYLREISLL